MVGLRQLMHRFNKHTGVFWRHVKVNTMTKVKDMTSVTLAKAFQNCRYFLANSIDRECITPAPRLASSSISS